MVCCAGFHEGTRPDCQTVFHSLLMASTLCTLHGVVSKIARGLLKLATSLVTKRLKAVWGWFMSHLAAVASAIGKHTRLAKGLAISLLPLLLAVFYWEWLVDELDEALSQL